MPSPAAPSTATHPHPIREQAIAITLPGGHLMRGFLAEPTDLTHAPGVLVLHEITGLNADIERITRRFAANGLVALAPDLFDGPGLKALCVSRAVYGMQTGRGVIFEYLAAAQEALEGQARCDSERVAVAGFCMGGGFAILHALKNSNLRASAPFYGAVPKRAEALAGICPVVASFGGRDRIFAPHGRRLKRHLEALGTRHDVKLYPDSGHSFMSEHEPGLTTLPGKYGPMRVGYQPEDAEDAWQRMLAFFAEQFAAVGQARPAPPA